MRHLVIGMGEVGSAVYEVLKEKHEVLSIDKGGEAEGDFDFVHICIPYSTKFRHIVKAYQKKYPGVTVIHSTVPMGTSRKLNAVHSPIRGVHPNLKKGVQTFVKYFGGKFAVMAAKEFSWCGVKTEVFSDSETTEAIKLWDTTYYGWNIVFNKEMKKFCDKYGLDFEEVYTRANTDYNEGYTKLGRPDVVRPVLKYMPGEIGGHCIIPNCEILRTPVATAILKKNREYRRTSVDK